MRYERKYRIETLPRFEVESVVYGHPMSFKTLFPDRQVNNIYLDTPDLEYLSDNLIGAPQRRKYRIRWYGPLTNTVENPVLEIKIKDNELGTKVMAPLDGFEMNDYRGLNSAVEKGMKELLYHQKEIPGNNHNPRPLPLVALEPVLLNTYNRSYYISYNNKFRLTIDSEMKFYFIGQSHHISRGNVLDPAIVIELKYDQKDDTRYDEVGQFLPFRLGKNSKYVNGMLLTGNV